MKRTTAAAIAVLVLVLTLAVYAPWLPLYILLWFGCPDYNALGGCGDYYPLGFILVRVAVVAGVFIVGRILWKLATKGGAE